MQRKRKDAAASMGNLKTGDKVTKSKILIKFPLMRGGNKQANSLMEGVRKTRPFRGHIKGRGESTPLSLKIVDFFRQNVKNTRIPLKKLFILKVKFFIDAFPFYHCALESCNFLMASFIYSQIKMNYEKVLWKP